jgi:hypothetical protein
MPWQLDMIDAVGTDVIRDVVADLRRGPAQLPVTPNPRPGVSEGRLVPGSKGWSEPAPLASPPGTALCDKLMDEQDRRDKRELERRLKG